MTATENRTRDVTVPTQVARVEPRSDADLSEDVAGTAYSWELPHAHSPRCYWDVAECRWQCCD